jgi:hypothetical protein
LVLAVFKGKGCARKRHIHISLFYPFVLTRSFDDTAGVLWEGSRGNGLENPYDFVNNGLSGM